MRVRDLLWKKVIDWITMDYPYLSHKSWWFAKLLSSIYSLMDFTFFWGAKNASSCIPLQTTNLTESGLWFVQVGGLFRDYERGCASHVIFDESEDWWNSAAVAWHNTTMKHDETTWFVLHDVGELDGFAMISGDFFQYLEMKWDKQHRCERFVRWFCEMWMFSRNLSYVAAMWADRKMFFSKCLGYFPFGKFLSTMSSAQNNMKRVTHRELIWDDIIQPEPEKFRRKSGNVCCDVNTIEFNVLIHPSNVEFHGIPSKSLSWMI